MYLNSFWWFYLPDPLQDVGGKRRHSRRTGRKLHQHRQQLEEGIRCLRDKHVCDVKSCLLMKNEQCVCVVLTSGVSLAMEVNSIDTIYTREKHNREYDKHCMT